MFQYKIKSVIHIWNVKKWSHAYENHLQIPILLAAPLTVVNRLYFGSVYPIH